MSLLNSRAPRDIIERVQAGVWVGHGIASGVPAGLDFADHDAAAESLVVVATLQSSNDHGTGSAADSSNDIVELSEVMTDSADAVGADDTVDVVGAREELSDEISSDAALEMLAVDAALGAADASALLVAKDVERGAKDTASED